jgi:hypothetical protein
MFSGDPPYLPSPIEWQPTRPLPQIPSTQQVRPGFVRNNKTATPSKYSSSTYEPIHHLSAFQSVFEPEASTRYVSPASGCQPSIGTPIGSAGSTTKRKGPPEVRWDASKDRKYARLYSLSDADIDDLPIIMRDDKLKFE